DLAVRHPGPAQGHRRVRRQAAARRAEPAELQGARHADRRGRLLAGFLTSKGTPPAMAARLNDEVKKILAMPDIAKKITELGGDVRTSANPAEFAGWLAKAIEQWGAVVKAEGIQVDG